MLKKYRLKNRKKILLHQREYQKQPSVITKRHGKKARREKAEYDKQRSQRLVMKSVMDK